MLVWIGGFEGSPCADEGPECGEGHGDGGSGEAVLAESDFPWGLGWGNWFLEPCGEELGFLEG